MSTTRQLIVGPENVQPPYPVVARTKINGGFGRGSSELGIPTANIPPGDLGQLEPGIYFGWARVSSINESLCTKQVGERAIEFNYGSKLTAADKEVMPMVMSIGWNPFFENKEKSAEVHIIHKFANLFYGAEIGVVVAGFIRHEQKYESLDALINDIHTDIEAAKASLDRDSYQHLRSLLR